MPDLDQTSSISERISDFVAAFSPQIPTPEARDAAKYLILDAVGIAFASSTFDFAKKTGAALDEFGSGDGVVIGRTQRLAFRDAAYLNGVLIHGLDYDDTHLASVVHVSGSCFPTALAVAAHLGRSGKDLLAAYIIGVETAARIGAVAKGELNQVGFHPTGVIAAFGTALAAGWLYGLDRDQLTMAQGIALSMAAGTREYSTEGAWTKRLHPGWASVSGITAAVLARQGFIGPRLTYEGKFGLFPTHLKLHGGNADFAAATANFGTVWEVAKVAIKPFPAGMLGIACIDAALIVSRKPGFDADQIAHVEAVVPPHAVNIMCEPIERRRLPHTSYAAQFSIPFLVAASLIHRKLGLTELELFEDSRIRALAQRVTYRVDPNTDYPVHFPGEVEVTMRDGTRLRHSESINRGGADRPVTPEETTQKYFDNAALVLPRNDAEKIRDAIMKIETRESARDFAALLARDK